jgi:hypothetical protein
MTETWITWSSKDPNSRVVFTRGEAYSQTDLEAVLYVNKIVPVGVIPLVLCQFDVYLNPEDATAIPLESENVKIDFAEFGVISEDDPMVRIHGRETAREYMSRAYSSVLKPDRMGFVAQQWLNIQKHRQT